MSAVTIRSLSARGSRNFPRVVTIPLRLARYPSSVSVMAAAEEEKGGDELVDLAGIKEHEKDEGDGQDPDDRNPVGKGHDLFAIQFFHGGHFRFQIAAGKCEIVPDL